MDCPVCREALQPTERLGIALAVCPACRGVWLGRGELAKMVARVDRDLPERESDATGQHREGGPAQAGRSDERRIDLAAEARLHDPFADRRPPHPEPSFLSQLFDV